MTTKTIRRPSFAAVMCAACGIACGAVTYAAREDVTVAIGGVFIVCCIFFMGCLYGGLEE